MKRFLFSALVVPRFIVLVVDFIVIALAFVFSYFVVKHFQFTEILRGHLLIYTVTYSFSALTVFFLMRIHTGVIRFSTFMDMYRIFAAIMLTGILYAILDFFIIREGYKVDSLNNMQLLVVNFFVSSSALIMLRIAVRGFYYSIRIAAKSDSERILIYGSGQKALVVKQAFESSDDGKYTVIGFLGEKENTPLLNIQQKRVYNINHLPMLAAKNKIDRLAITSDDLGIGFKKQIVDKCLELGIKILTVPPSEQWVYGKLKLKQIQDLKIEDLLHRDPIQISDVNVFQELSGKKILITGAAGSIGSEIVRQVLSYRPAMLIMCDQAESPLHDMQVDVESKFPNVEIKTHIASIRSLLRMKVPFEEFRPDIVFHAAAYKHVPMMENNPVEAILTNVLGTKHVADLALHYKAEKFVMISTDKAVNPTNVMGASKRIAEIYIQSLNEIKGSYYTRFMTTRFGNVLDSSGSVIPRFRSQIQAGGPITVTHPDITRYFMTIPEAVRLVLEAGCMGRGGEIFVFDMGRPVKIVDLAKNMVKLAGLTLDSDIKIVFTGLRAGEKLYEELLNDDEHVLPTHHEKIKIARVRQHEPELVRREVNQLLGLTKTADASTLVCKMKKMVPEFKSQNSMYSDFDRKDVEVNL